MSDALALPSPSLTAALLNDDLARAHAYAQAEKAPATQRAYASDYAVFSAWCASRGVAALPAAPETLAAFLADQADAGLSAPTLARRLAALRHAHRLSGHTSPTEHEAVRATLRGIRRTIGRPPARKRPATADIVRRLVADLPDSLAGRRDRALLLLGFAGALRRSELVALDVADLAETPEGLRVTIRRSKTDSDGKGVTIGVLRGHGTCPVRAVQEWLAAAGIERGPVFRPVTRGDGVRDARLTDKGVTLILKRHAARAGFDPSAFAGHSLRAGFLTSAAGRGASLFRMIDVSRHKSLDTLRAYVREADLFKDHAGAGLL